MKSVSCLACLVLLVLTSFAQAGKDSFYTANLAAPGVKMIPVYEGRYKVFTQKTGTGDTHLLLLSGGPGDSYEYFENFPPQLNKAGISVYFYEQLGNYYSDQPDDSTIWRVQRFVEEVEEVRKGLGLDQFFLLGHSWGGLLAEAYAAKYGRHLKGLILSNIPGFPANDTSYFYSLLDSMEQVIRVKTVELPRFAAHKMQIDSISLGLKIADTALAAQLKPVFRKMNDSLFGRTMHYRKAGPMPEPLARGGKHYTPPGGGKYTFDIFEPDYAALMKKIITPTLLLGARYDFLHDERYHELKKEMKQARVRVYICPNGAHFTMWDDTDHYFKALTRFINDVNTRRFDPDK